MGKRTRDSYEDFKFIAQKIKKLEEVYKHARRRDRDRRQRNPSSSSSSSSETSSVSRTSDALPSLPEPLNIEGVPTTLPGSGDGAISPRPSTSAAAYDPIPSTSTAAAEPLFSISGAARQVEHIPNMTILPITDTDAALPAALDQIHGLEEQPPELDDEILQILGEDPSQIKTYGKDIQNYLAVRLQHIATSGLTKEARKKLLHKYLHRPIVY